MATKIRLMRMGKIRAPQYRIVVSDSRTKRDGRFIEAIGKYHPKEDPSLIEVNSERAQYWLSVGAQPTEPVAAILKITGDWQKFKGEPGESTLKTRAPRPDRKALFEEAAREGLGESTGGAATTPKKKSAPKAGTEKPETPAEPEAPVAEGGADTAGEASDQPATSSDEA